MSRIIVVMGVSGAGKTTVGRAIADQLGWPFYDADDWHSAMNIAKMTAGQPLTDGDRSPWLMALRDQIRHLSDREQNAVMACSALRKSYRAILRVHDGVQFVYLKGTREFFAERLARREGHFMPMSLLDSQFETLEEPEDAITLDAAISPTALAEQVAKQIQQLVK